MPAAALKSWTNRMLGRQLDESGIDPALLEKKGVALVEGRNNSGDPIYVYLELTLANLRLLSAKIDSGDDFNVTHYGHILKAGAGKPSRELAKEMKEKYKIADLR